MRYFLVKEVRISYRHSRGTMYNQLKVIVTVLNLFLLLTKEGFTKGECIVTVTQESLIEVENSSSSVVIPCTFSSTGCDLSTLDAIWFRYNQNSHEELSLNQQPEKYKLNKNTSQQTASLEIKSVISRDSGHYICGIAFLSSDSPGSKQTGTGTDLVVRETKNIIFKKEKILLSVLFALLVLYSIAISVLLFICQSKSETTEDAKKKKKKASEQEDKQQKENTTRRVFQNIAQELYNKKYVWKNQRSQQEPSVEIDDIYQNS
ncbi:immunoglobulin superfamily member 6 isoform X1 [Protopterus annectens]|uniref:immunoglobulin superfamily member 6 isoform X1 n=1 Tax=Protopterus annectens TaxID=7888 RepID=UPI001CFB912F|nr:immunoglobulin superfamily member 6 isoform X1 [Protopterus annectens]